MAHIGIFFGTDTGRTRRIAKEIRKKLGDAAADPVNVAKATPEDLLSYRALILGTPTLGEGELPGQSTGLANDSWAEFLPKLAGLDFTGKVVALYGLGDQDKYADDFVSALRPLYEQLADAGATLVGHWPTTGYTFKASAAVEDGAFLGLALDQINHPALSEGRLDAWLAQILPQLNA
jgi:flavodoxin I